MKSKLFSILKYIFLFLIGLVLLWLTFRKENLAEVFGRMAQADPFWLFFSVVLGVVAFISRAIRWVILMEPLGYKPSVSNTFYSLQLGYFANLAIPRIGEITRCGALAGVEKIPFNSLIGTVIVERVIDLIMLLFSILIVGILEYDMLRDFLMAKVIGPMSGKFGFLGSPWFIASMVLVVVIAIVIIRRAGKDHHNQSAFVKKVRGIAHEVGSGFKTILRMKNNGWFLFHTFFIWFLYFLMTWVCFFCLTSTEHLGFDAGMFVLVAGGLGMTAPVQGGIGAYHYVVSQSLQLFGISSTDGIAYATLVHTTQLLTVVGLGILAMIMLSVQRRKKDENKPV